MKLQGQGLKKQKNVDVLYGRTHITENIVKASLCLGPAKLYLYAFNVLAHLCCSLLVKSFELIS